MFNDNNIKGEEQASIDLSLEQLQLDYVDLLLIHNPITSRNEYRAACATSKKNHSQIRLKFA